jgi:hypothetical protein
MDALSAGPGSSLSDSLWSGVESDASGAPSITIPSTHPDTNSSQQKHLRTDIKTINTYLAREEAPKSVRDALERVREESALGG